MAASSLKASAWKTIKPLLTGPGDFASRTLGIIIKALLLLSGNSRSPRVGKLLGSLLLAGKRKNVLANVRTVLGVSSAQLDDGNIWEGYRTHLGMTLLELDWMLEQNGQELAKYVALEGEDMLRGALSKGKGALLLFNHYENFGCVAAGLGLRGYGIGMSANRLPFPSMDSGLTEKFNHFATVRIDAGRTMLLSGERILRKNGLFAVAADYSVRHRHAAWLRFGEAEVLANLAPLIFAMRRRTPILCATISRIPDDRRLLTIHPPLCYDEQHDPISEARALMETALSLLCNQIREQPAHWWLWDHCMIRPIAGGPQSGVADASSKPHSPEI